MNPFGIEVYHSKRMPWSEKALYVAALIGFVAAIAACLYT